MSNTAGHVLSQDGSAPRVDLAVALQGVDERASIDPATGRNKYHLNPLDFQGLFNRGSCTNSTLTPFTAGVIDRFLRDLHGPLAEVRRDHERRLKGLLNVPGHDRFECFFGPSGSDLAYLPIAFARVLHPGRPILNLLTCPEELGSGTLVAAEGRVFMTRNQFGEPMTPGTLLDAGSAATVLRFKARNESGDIVDHRGALRETIASHRDRAIIGSLVIGSKSGIEENVDFIEHVGEDVLWVVDLCQFRNSKRLVNKLLDMNCMVMITGSKFYEAPPFCGVMLIPKPLVARLKAREPEGAQMLRKVFAEADCPEGLPGIRAQLTPHHSLGLLTRWEAALAEMEAFDSIPAEQTRRLTGEWNALVTRELERRECFELIPDQNVTNPTIVSFRVKQDGRYLDKPALDTLFRGLVLGRCDGLRGFTRVNIGQPVNYGERSFIRIAIGANGIRTLLPLPPEERYLNDLTLIDVLERQVRRLRTGDV
jgi:hypothetical protein